MKFNEVSEPPLEDLKIPPLGKQIFWSGEGTGGFNPRWRHKAVLAFNRISNDDGL
jgi:hypothetical protein